jgi:hypothetical protein
VASTSLGPAADIRLGWQGRNAFRHARASYDDDKGTQEQCNARGDFAGAGWTLVSCDEVTWRRSASLAEDFDRLKLRAVSVFEHMSAEVAEAGFARIEAALPSLDAGPQYETSELLVFRR